MTSDSSGPGQPQTALLVLLELESAAVSTMCRPKADLHARVFGSAQDTLAYKAPAGSALAQRRLGMSRTPFAQGLAVPIHREVMRVEDAGIAAVAAAGIEVRLLGRLGHRIGIGIRAHGMDPATRRPEASRGPGGVLRTRSKRLAAHSMNTRTLALTWRLGGYTTYSGHTRVVHSGRTTCKLPAARCGAAMNLAIRVMPKPARPAASMAPASFTPTVDVAFTSYRSSPR